MRVDVGCAVGSEKWRRHCKIIAASRIIFIATFCLSARAAIYHINHKITQNKEVEAIPEMSSRQAASDAEIELQSIERTP